MSLREKGRGREESHVETHAEPGVLQLQVKGPLEPPEAAKPPSDPSEGVWSCQHPDFRLVASRTVRGQLSLIIIATQFRVLCYTAPEN